MKIGSFLLECKLKYLNKTEQKQWDIWASKHNDGHVEKNLQKTLMKIFTVEVVRVRGGGELALGND